MPTMTISALRDLALRALQRAGASSAMAQVTADALVDTLGAVADAAYAASNSSPRSRPAAEIASFLAARDVPTQEFADVEAALDAATSAAGEGDLILVTGSLYTVADARRARGDP